MKNKALKKEAIAIQTRVMVLSLAAVFMVYLVLSMFPATASLGSPEPGTKTVGATTITWDSSFLDDDYTVGATITLMVNWTVDAGSATYDSFSLRGPRFTPKSKWDPATGTLPGVTLIDDSDDDSDGDGYKEGAVEVVFEFTGLHLDRKRNVEIGNAKFKLYLMVEDLIGNFLKAGYGVNVHVEDPQ